MAVDPLTQRIHQLERMLDVSRNLSAVHKLDPLLQMIIDVAVDLTNSQESSILLYDEKNDDLEFVAGPWFKRDKMSEVRVPLSKSIAGQVYIYGEPILVQDAKNDPRVFTGVDEHTKFETKSMLCVPMFFKGISTGVLTAVNKKHGEDYTEEDIEILKTLASQAAIAIQNYTLLNDAQKAFKDLSQVDRMKTDFLAITSHELRTPLGLILGHATFLAEMVPDDLKNQMNVILKSALRLKDIVEDLSKVNSFQTGQSRVRWHQVDIRKLVESTVASFKSSAAEINVTLEIDLPKEPLSVEGEEEKLGIALSHLIRNAIGFSREGGKVRVAAQKLSGYVKIQVIDNGQGIPKKDLTRIFDRFYQVERHMTRSHSGMGLGLSVAKVMVEMHSGRISVQSEEGKGSTFSILLPGSTDEAERKQLLGE